MTIRIALRRVRPDAASNPLPAYETAGAAGMDLRADLASSVDLRPGERALVPTGIAIALPRGFEAQIRARSGLAWKRGIGLLNGPGTVDSDYRGEIHVILHNFSNEIFTIEPGSRIAQLVVARYERVEWDEVAELTATSRQDGGFGHTGTE